MAITSNHDASKPARRGWPFWIVFLALCLCLLLTGLDLASVGTALPVITRSLGGNASFAWVSSAYTLSATAVLPLSGRLSELFGRRDVLFVFIIFFTVGSVICARAQTMGTLIAGRTLQGVGNGGIQSLTSIVVADLMTLQERGMFNALLGIAFTTASLIGPFIAGAIAQETTWRWLVAIHNPEYMNLPLCAIALSVVFVFLCLKKPEIGSASETFAAMDIPGNMLIVASTTVCIIALTWAGATHPWTSASVLAPLILGLLGLAGAFVYKLTISSRPLIPLGILDNRTSLSGYAALILHLIYSSFTVYISYVHPAYFQAVKVASPLHSGIFIFPIVCVISPSAILQGIFISKTGKYWMVHLIGWSLMLVALGLFTIIDRTSSVGETVPMQMIMGISFGFLYATTFSVLAPLPPTLNAQALSFLMFVRTFSQSWGIAIAASVLQNELLARLPLSALRDALPDHSFLPGSGDLSYALIPLIKQLHQPLQDEVRDAFAKSLRVVWILLLALAGAGWVCVWGVKELTLHTKKDERWGLDTKEAGREETDVGLNDLQSARKNSEP
ncbi:iron permease [Punctularia strigosozonata HHB-11173 SS5]|uniref:iron permease n=1 Tax=Punctularia strigosozonata (strain HHB-11173) TaxID=741275 RepID=UPI0004417A30|nr:iron permease [Punctularia strigosozonata HHB-11173 SS5]EIN06465.1 iron permease [Punctularia strigosozonata HHB-11173 SS5]